MEVVGLTISKVLYDAPNTNPAYAKDCHRRKYGNYSQLLDTFISSTRPLTPFSNICRQPVHTTTQLQILDLQLQQMIIKYTP